MDLKTTHCAALPEAIFLLGCKYEYLSENIRDYDRRRHLSLRSVLENTPPVWVRLPAFWIGKRMVSNGEYLRFLEYTEEENGAQVRLYDSAGVWRYVWQSLNHRVEKTRVAFERAPGDIAEFDEDYSDCQGFVEAYLSSLKYEVQRVLLGSDAGGETAVTDESSPFLMVKQHGATTKKIAVPREEILKRIFALLKYLLCNAILLPGEDLYTVLNEREQNLVRMYERPDQALADVTQLVEDLRKAYRRRIDKRFVMPFQNGTFPIEPVQFLTRVAAQLRKFKDMNQPVSLRDVLYPRYWPTPGGDSARKDFMGNQVPWEEQPVVGVTLYEALAFTAWLSKVSGSQVTLPNEAEFERASSWPAEEPPAPGSDVVLDPTKKKIFPWQDHNAKDFHSYFGREGAEISNFYLRNKKEYTTLLEETARVVKEGVKIHQLEGFGWQWTCDRYADDERKYLRFEDHDYPRWSGVRCTEVAKPGQSVVVHDYRANSNLKCSFFVLKGSPDIIGGPGLTTRRYAANPMRSYPNVGFRIAIQQDP